MGALSATVPESMSFDLEEMLRSKQALRLRLAALPIAEKLRMLDALRERALLLRHARNARNVAREEEPSDKTQRKVQQ